MSHRTDQKEARRQERLRQEAEARRRQRRQRLARRSGVAAVAVIAGTLVTLAVALGGGSGTAPADHMGAASATGPVIGTRAPGFELTDVVSNRQVALSSFAGRKTLLFFSEGVGCQACMVQAADLQKNNALRRAGVRLVSVTTDVPGDLGQAARQYGIRTPLLADPTTRMSAAYGMLGHGGMGHPTQDGHAFMLLDAKGKVLWHQAYQEMYVQPSQLLSDMGLRT
jgi:peroxiredoxin